MTFHPTIHHKVYLAILNPYPQLSSIAIVNLKTLKIIKEIRYMVHDVQSTGLTDDNRYLLVTVGGFQRYDSGTIVLDIESDMVIGFIPGSQGSHDIAPVYTSMKHLKNSRSCVL
ncbi:hypothetical protein HK104_002865 [Borealophlyctis nickersoniae]|nr:hypothetical protein HK104_002865 [Borealophlyctis nickersoniae]